MILFNQKESVPQTGHWPLMGHSDHLRNDSYTSAILNLFSQDEILLAKGADNRGLPSMLFAHYDHRDGTSVYVHSSHGVGALFGRVRACVYLCV